MIPAAGLGRRMGSSVHKQYLALNGRPLLAHTVALFDAHPLVDRLYIISPADQISYCRHEIVEAYGFSKVHGIITGGVERQDSVRLGLLNCHAEAQDTLVIHDGVRPLFPAQQLAEVLAGVQRCGACVVGVPVKDTIKQVTAGMIAATPPRAGLWAAQTPQAFRYELILAAHLAAQQQGYHGTDDASLLEWQGQPVAMLAGCYRNIKITTPEDLLVAQAFFDTPSVD